MALGKVERLNASAMKTFRVAQVSHNVSESSAPYRLNEALGRHAEIESYLLLRRTRNGVGEEITRSSVRRVGDALKRLLARSICRMTVPYDRNTPFYSVLGMGFKKEQMEKADIVNLHWIAGRTLDFSRLRYINRPLVYTLHDTMPVTGGCHGNLGCTNYRNGCAGGCPRLGKILGSTAWTGYIFRKKKEYFSGIPSLTIVTPSKWLLNMVHESGMFEGRRMVQIYNPVDTGLFIPSSNKREAKNRLGIPENAFVIAVGAVNLKDPFKGGEYVLPIVYELYKRGLRNIHILLFGGSGDTDSYPYAVTNSGFIADINRLVGVYQAADLFLNPSKQDNLSSVSLEAMSCGVPSVCFRTGGTPEICRDGETGLLADQFDIGQMADHCERLYTNEELKWKLGAQGRACAEKEFCYSSISGKYERLYQEVLEEWRSATLSRGVF